MFWAKVLRNIFVFILNAMEMRQQPAATNGELLHLVDDQQNCRIFRVHLFFFFFNQTILEEKIEILLYNIKVTYQSLGE